MTLTLHYSHADLFDVCICWWFPLNKQRLFIVMSLVFIQQHHMQPWPWGVSSANIFNFIKVMFNGKTTHQWKNLPVEGSFWTLALFSFYFYQNLKTGCWFKLTRTVLQSTCSCESAGSFHRIVSHRWSLCPWQTWHPHVPLHATWSRLALFALFALLSSAALRSFISCLSWWACL